jgi:HEAT repeat protein
MGRVPIAASVERVEAAFGPEGEGVCGELVRLLRDKDKVVVERAARTLKKIAERDGEALFAWRKKLLDEAFRAVDVRVQWNLTVVIGKLPLKGADKALAVDLMFERLQDRSGLNRTMAMQALMDLSEQDRPLRARVMPVVLEFLEEGTPAMRARARRLLGITR